MKIAFQADAELNPEIERGLRRREPAIDFRGAKGVIPAGTSDPEVLRIAAEAGRVLVTRDVATIPITSDIFLDNTILQDCSCFRATNTSDRLSTHC